MPSKQMKSRANQEQRTQTRPILDLSRTVVRHLEQYKIRPWDVIPSLRNYIPEYGIALPYDQYDEIAENVWIHVSAYLSPNARIDGPAIIGGGAEIRHFSYIKNAVIGAFATVGEFSSVKNSILFDRVSLHGHNEVLSSVIGYECVIGAGSILADTRADKACITFDMPEGVYLTGKSHLGSVICDTTRIGAGCVIAPGTVIDYGSTVSSSESLLGYFPPYSGIEKSRDTGHRQA